MNKWSADKQQKIAAVAGATVAVVVALWFFVISPLRAEQAKLRTALADAKSQMEKGRRNTLHASQVSNELAEASSRMNKEEQQMASGDLDWWMTQTINQFKKPYPVDIPQVGKGTPREVGVFPKFPYKAVAFILRGSGYYHDVGKFLADFENHFPYMRLQNLDLGARTGPNEEDPERLTLTLEVVTLVKPLAP